MTQTGFTTPTNKTKLAGVPLKSNLKLTTGTDCYAGRLVAKGASDGLGVVCTSILPPVGFISYEDTTSDYQPATYATAFAASDIAGIIFGPIIVKGSMVAGTTCVKGDLLANWAAGQVIPVARMGGGLAIKIPYTKSTTKVVSVTLPAGVIVKDVIVQSVVADASGTIDVGLTTTDTDGFLDGAALAATGFNALNLVDATAANITKGTLFQEVQIKDATGTPVYTQINLNPGYQMAAAEALCYTTSDHTQSGFLWVVIDHPSFQVVGKAENSVDASSAAADVQVRCMI
jgi:hypothetical protein